MSPKRISTICLAALCSAHHPSWHSLPFTRPLTARETALWHTWEREHSFSDSTEAVAQKMQVKWQLFPLDHILSTILVRLLSVSAATLSLTCRTWNSSKSCWGRWKSFCSHSNSDNMQQMRQELCTELPPFHRESWALWRKTGLLVNHWTGILDCHVAGEQRKRFG